MDLIGSETSLVVAGSWNAAILAPAWVLKYGFELAEGASSTVQVQVPVAAGAVFEFPRYSFDGITYVVRPGALVVAPVEFAPERLDYSEAVAARIVDVLSHTPITGIGHNFEFREADPIPEHVAVFTRSRQDLVDNMSKGWAAAGGTLASSFKNESESVVMNIQRQLNGGTVAVKFNFHHPVSTAAQATSILKGADGYLKMKQNFELAKQLIELLYGEANSD